MLMVQGVLSPETQPMTTSIPVTSVTSQHQIIYLKGFEHKVWEDGDYWLYYKVEQTSQNSAPFVEISGTYNGPPGNDHKWDNTTENINLLDGLSPGDYNKPLRSGGYPLSTRP